MKREDKEKVNSYLLSLTQQVSQRKNFTEIWKRFGTHLYTSSTLLNKVELSVLLVGLPGLIKNFAMISKKKYSYNQFRNILRLFDVLPNFSFTTSETIDDYYMVYTRRATSRVAERLKTQDLRKLGKIREVYKLHRMIAQCPVFLSK